MKTARPVELGKLADEQSIELRSMEAAIRGTPDATLWTSTMRASIRGGKPCGFSRLEDEVAS